MKNNLNDHHQIKATVRDHGRDTTWLDVGVRCCVYTDTGARDRRVSQK